MVGNYFPYLIIFFILENASSRISWGYFSLRTNFHGAGIAWLLWSIPRRAYESHGLPEYSEVHIRTSLRTYSLRNQLSCPSHQHPVEEYVPHRDFQGYRGNIPIPVRHRRGDRRRGTLRLPLGRSGIRPAGNRGVPSSSAENGTRPVPVHARGDLASLRKRDSTGCRN